MTKNKKQNLRNNEYYGMQAIFDGLYLNLIQYKNI